MSAMQLYIQDPTDQQAPIFHEKILEICDGAMRGAGAFAFATRDGVHLLLGDEVFRKFLGRGTFDLIVGVDEVTDSRALEALKEMSRESSGLRVRVFFHNLPLPMFHPKCCWFRHRTNGFLVAGSGNLTARGLRGNWEAFAIAELDAKSMDALEAQWKRWVGMHTKRLLSLDDKSVLDRAALNVRKRREGTQVPVPETEEREADGETIAALTRPRQVLVAEIPRASDRWNQANFDLRSFRDFFGAQPGTVL
jgi:hypothetical protein